VTKREIGFLLIGLGFGLVLAVAAVLEVLLSLYRSAFITAYSWGKLFIIVPILLLVIGVALIFTDPHVSKNIRRARVPGSDKAT